jgi:signal transduction histidine kinase
MSQSSANEHSGNRSASDEDISAHERYRAFIAQSTEGIWRFELEQPVPINMPPDELIEAAYKYGYLAECNDAMARMYGMESAEQITGARLGELLIRSDPNNIAYLKAFIDSGFKLTDAESHEKDNNGNDKYFLNNFIGVIENGRLLRAWGTQRDITDRIKIEEELRATVEECRRAKDAAEAANRAKTDFLSVVSHELRTPLTPMLLMVSMLEQSPGLSDEMKEDIVSIRQNIELEARLIDDLLDISRITRGKLSLSLSNTDLHQAIKAAVDICERGDAADLQVELAASKSTVRGDPTRLRQIVWNLLSNAIKFTPRDGHIVVRTDNPTANSIRVQVTDTGIGIEQADLGRIFNAFEQGSAGTRQFGGLGLGLAISHWLAEAQGGSLTASSAGKNCGATFVLTLPLI